MAVESHLNNTFYESAKRAEKEMQGKTYSYKLYSGMFMDNLVKQGKCIIDNRKYDRGIDCDILTVTDITTKETFLANQFAILLEVV